MIAKIPAINEEFQVSSDTWNLSAIWILHRIYNEKKLPTAIFCHSDEMAFGALKAIRKKGLRVPEDISVIGFDDHDIAQYIGLTTVSQPPQFEGQVAAAAAIAEVADPTLERKNIVVPLSLVVRDTTAAI